MSIYEICAIIGVFVWVVIGWYIVLCFRHLASVMQNSQEIVQKINTETMDRIHRHLERTESILEQVDKDTVPAVNQIANHVAHTMDATKEMVDSWSNAYQFPKLILKRLSNKMPFLSKLFSKL